MERLMNGTVLVSPNKYNYLMDVDLLTKKQRAQRSA